MAIPDNNDNLSWNTSHLGNRVPVNDSDAEGDPTAQGAHQDIWKEGSINRAVRSAWLADGRLFDPADEAESLLGILDLKRLTNYTIPDLLYGYKGPAYLDGDGVHGDAWFKTPGDAMSFRGYPTITVSSDFEYIYRCTNCFDLNLDGSPGSSLGDYAFLRARIRLNYISNYDVIIIVFWEGVNYKLKILAGDTISYQYALENSSQWFPLSQGYMFFTVPIPTVSTTYLFRLLDTFPEIIYKNYTSPIELTIEPTVDSCPTTIWFFGPSVRSGGTSDVFPTDPIVAIYNDPQNAFREIHGLTAKVYPGQLGQRVVDLGVDQSFTNGFEMAMGENNMNEFNCYTSYLNAELINNQYLWIGTASINDNGDPVYLIDVIWRIDANNLLVDERICTGEPAAPTLDFYEQGFYDDGFYLNQ